MTASGGAPTRRVAFLGGRVWTAGYADSRALDVLVDGDRIRDVGLPGTLRVEGAEVRDIRGKLLMPGFQDAHIHMSAGGMDLLTCDLAGLESPEGVYSAIAKYADANPDLPWIVGGGWDRSVFPRPEGPTRQKLDELVGGRPAFISPYDRHGAWVSTAAFEAARVTSATPDPQGGSFRRDTDGTLTGMVAEAAIEVIRAAMPAVTTQEVMQTILKAQEFLLPLGITSVQDALVGAGLGMLDSHAAYTELVAGDELKLRATTALWWDATRGLEQIPELQAKRERLERAARADRVIADTVKIMVDGARVIFLDAEQIREATVALDRLGFTLHYHSYGEGTTHHVLNAIEAAILANGPHRRRHHIAHLFVIAPQDFARFGTLGVTANLQGHWAGSHIPHESLSQSTITADPQNREYPFGRLQAAGARLAGGSDWPVSTPNPLECAQAAAGLLPEPGVRKEISSLDLLDPASMLTAYTTGSAWVNGRGSSTGRVTPGFLADLIVIDRDILAGEDALGDAVVTETWIGGLLEHERL